MTTSTNSVVLALPPEDAFALVCDPALYPRWLVGAETIRHIDAEWPAVDSTFEHRIGIGPAAVPGSTTVRRLESPRVLELAAGMGVLGEAKVLFEFRPVVGGTEVRIVETPRKGVVSLAAKVMSRLVRGALWGRNEASLHELGKLVADLSQDTSTGPQGAPACGDRAGADASGGAWSGAQFRSMDRSAGPANPDASE